MKIAFVFVALALLAGAANADPKSDVVAYAKKYFPNNEETKAKMENLLETYAGKEDELLKVLVKERTTGEVHRHFQKHRPSKLESVAEMVKKNAGKEEELIAELKAREKDIAKTRKFVDAWFKANPKSDLLDRNIEKAMHKYYNKEHKLMKILKEEPGATQPGAINWGGLLDLVVGIGLIAGAVYIISLFMKKEVKKKKKSG